MRTTLRLLLLLGLVATLVVPVGASEGEEPTEPSLRTERTYFTCGDVNKVRLVNGLQGDFDTWDTTAPDTPFTAGGGCGTSSTPLINAEVNGTWEGTFTGNLDAIAVEIHMIDVGLSRVPGEEYAVTPFLSIDGEGVSLELGDGYVPLETVRSETGLTVRGRMTITGLGITPELGDGDTERTVRLRLIGTPVDSGAFVWDATEVPSGLTFNPEAVEGTQVRSR